MKVLLIVVVLSFSVFASLEFINPHIAHVIPGSSVTAAFLKIKNKSDQEISLVGASASWAKTLELHNHMMEEGVMAMRKVDKMVIPAKGELVLKSKSYHIMIFKIQEEVKLNESKKITLKFSNKETKEVDFKIIDVYAKEHKHH